MAESRMQGISELLKKDLINIKLLVFDVDGVIVPRGTKIKQKGDKTIFETKKLNKKQIMQIEKLYKIGFLINISSGRGLYMLQKIFKDVLDFVSLTYENGSATWCKGKIYQHVNSFKKLENLFVDLQKIKNSRIKGFEPKEFIITIHCKNRVKQIETEVKKHKSLYYIWNDEAYDIGIKNLQTKASGLKAFLKILNLSRQNILFLGDNYNDSQIAKLANISITADKTRFKADFYIPLSNKKLPADVLMKKIILLYD